MIYSILSPLATEPAIDNLEAFRLIVIIGMAAISGPVFIGALIFLLKKF